MTAAVEHIVGIDVSMELSSLCIVNMAGDVVQEAMAVSDPEAIVAVLRGLRLPTAHVALKTGLLSHWISEGLHQAGFQVTTLEGYGVEETSPTMIAMASRWDACNLPHVISRQTAYNVSQQLCARLSSSAHQGPDPISTRTR